MMDDEQKLVALDQAYKSPGLAYSHTVAVLLDLKAELEEQIFRGAWNPVNGEDVTPYLRAAHEVCRRILAVPAVISGQADQVKDDKDRVEQIKIHMNRWPEQLA